MKALTYIENGKFALSEKAQAGDSGSTGCGCTGNFGQYLHQRSAHQARLCAPGRSRYHGGP